MPSITCLPNGPYSLTGAAVRRASGENVPVAEKAALCRCGGSKKKPFCDGTHRTNNFSDRNLADPAKNRRETYVGKGVTIYDNRALCAHAGVCTDNLASVFRYGQEPWIDPDGAAVEHVVATIRKCPSGALSYAVNGEEGKAPARPPLITVTDNGPYAVSGGVELAGHAAAERYTLCRCGASKNKPFCDGSHWNVNFKDP